jgi:hypothetical protein
LSIEQERRALVDAALVVEDAVGLADRAVRPVVGEQRKRQPAQLLRPDFQARNRIRADLQDFDVELLEFVVVRTEPVDLILSPTSEGERKESDDRAPSAIARQREFLVGMRREREVRRRAACL